MYNTVTINNKDIKIKHILGTDWLSVKLLEETDSTIKVELCEESFCSFEKNDKILLSVGSNIISEQKFNTIIIDIDFKPDANSIILSIIKPIEKRKNERYNIKLLCSYINDSLNGYGDVINVSLEGFKMLSKDYFKLRDSLQLNIVITDTEIISCLCTVIYAANTSEINPKQPFMYGLKIEEISFNDKKLLGDFIESIK